MKGIMKKTFLSLFAFFLLAAGYSPVKAQTSLGILVGPSVPNLSGGSNEISQDYVSRLALHLGITVEHDLSERFSIQPEIIFDQQGGQRNGLQPFPSPVGGYDYADFKNASILNYIEVPVLLHYKFGSRQLRYQVNAGPYFGYLLSATQKTSGTSAIYADKNLTPLPVPPQSFDATTDVTDSINRFNVGIQGGVGIAYPFSESQNLSLEIHGLYGLTNIQRYAVDGTNHTGNLLISMGYSFLLPGT
jgi:Outer membrane protein beta-barrel domain